MNLIYFFSCAPSFLSPNSILSFTHSFNVTKTLLFQRQKFADFSFFLLPSTSALRNFAFLFFLLLLKKMLEILCFVYVFFFVSFECAFSRFQLHVGISVFLVLFYLSVCCWDSNSTLEFQCFLFRFIRVCVAEIPTPRWNFKVSCFFFFFFWSDFLFLRFQLHVGISMSLVLLFSDFVLLRFQLHVGISMLLVFFVLIPCCWDSNSTLEFQCFLFCLFPNLCCYDSNTALEFQCWFICLILYAVLL